MHITHRITPCLWFDDEAEQAARFYTGIFNNSKITNITRYSGAGQEVHGKPPGSVMTVEFELDGNPFTSLNGGPQFQLSEAVSFQINCETQEEIDDYWDKLTEGGDKRAQQCGWLKDKFGVSWQVVPTILPKLFNESEPEKAQRTMAAMLQMKKLNIEALTQA